MTEDSESVMRILGRIETMTSNQEKRISDLYQTLVRFEDSSRENRATLHRRLDEQKDDIAHLRSSILIDAKISTQTRDKVDGLAKDVDEKIMPTVEEYARLKRLWIRSMVAIGGSATAFTTAAIYFADLAKSAVKAWLSS